MPLRASKDRGHNMGFLSLRERISIPTYDNPKELQTAELIFDQTKCNQCGVCISICPGAWIATDKFTRMDYMKGTATGKSGFPKLLRSANDAVTLCMGCLCCAAACSKDAISLKQVFRPTLRLKKLHQTAEVSRPKRY
jgi:ferredoxin